MSGRLAREGEPDSTATIVESGDPGTSCAGVVWVMRQCPLPQRGVPHREGTTCDRSRGETSMARRPSPRDFLTNLTQPMPLPAKLVKLTRNLWRRVALRQNCCGHPGEPGC
jgi:hypothetical protein